MIAMTSSTARLPSELWNALAAPWNWPLTPFGQRARRRLRARCVSTVAERRARLQAERDRHRRQLAVVVDRLRSDHLLSCARACRAARPSRRLRGRALPSGRRLPSQRRVLPLPPPPWRRRRLEIEQRQRRRIGLELRRELEQHLVFVDRRVDRRDPARAVGVVERVLDLVGGDAERRRLVAIDLDVDLRAGDLEVAREILEARHVARAPFSALRDVAYSASRSGDCIEN